LAAGRDVATVDCGWDAELRLRGLDDDALTRVACRALGARRLDESVLRWLRERTQGNPLFAAQLARSALDAGYLTVLPGRETCVATSDLGALAAPESLQAVLMSRVDRLSEADRRLVQVASVCGERFELETLAIVDGDLTIDQVRSAVFRLSVEGLISLDSGAVTFSHPLLRDAVYASLPTARREPLHRRVAQAMLQRADGRKRAAPEILAYHFSCAGDPRLVAYSLEAGARAQELGDGNAALRFFSSVVVAPVAIRRSRRDAVLQALVSSGDVLHAFLARHADSIVEYRRALRLLGREPSLGEVVSPAALFYRIGRSERRLGRERVALSWLRRALAPEAGGSPEERAEALLEQAGIEYLRGHHSRALGLCGEALTLAGSVDASRTVARALDARGTILSGSGNQEAAVADLRESVAIARRLGDPWAEANAENNLGAAYFWLGRWEQAAASYRRARERWQRAGDVDKTVQASSNLGEVLAAQGDIEEALQLFEECRAFWERSGFALGVAHARLFAGQALARSGRYQSAVAELEAAIATFAELGHDAVAAYANALLAEACADAGEMECAGAAAHSAGVAAQTAESRMVRAYALRAQAVAGRVDATVALRQLEEAITAFGRLRMAYERALTQLRLAEVAADAPATSAQRRPARRALDEALTVFERLGARAEIARGKTLESRLDAEAVQVGVGAAPVRSWRAGAARPVSAE
jgi:tetratricopeptide (TPR) repeat protein